MANSGSLVPPLLKGTKRGSLIDAGQMAECEIRVINLPHSQSI